MSAIPPIHREILVDANLATAFEAFTDDIGRWWPVAELSVYGAGGTVTLANQEIVERSADGHSALQGETSPTHYLHRRVLQPEILCGEQPQVVVNRLRTAGLLYQYDTGEGVILHILGALLGCGYVELTSIATSGADAAAIDEAALAVILHS